MRIAISGYNAVFFALLMTFAICLEATNFFTSALYFLTLNENESSSSIDAVFFLLFQLTTTLLGALFPFNRVDTNKMKKESNDGF